MEEEKRGMTGMERELQRREETRTIMRDEGGGGGDRILESVEKE